MQDTIIKGTGNSRSLASVPNFLTLYPTYEAFAQALINRELPIDIGPINPAGVDVNGTTLNVASLLTSETEISIWGDSANRTVNQALSTLKSTIETVKSSLTTSIDKKTGIITGTYTGSGGSSKTIYGISGWNLLLVCPLTNDITTKHAFGVSIPTLRQGFMIRHNAGSRDLAMDYFSTTPSVNSVTLSAVEFTNGNYFYAAITK